MTLFADTGVHALADGQFGSCGKGALAAWLALQAQDQGVEFKACVTNAGPNSGHTFYHDGVKIVLKQLPTFAVASYLMGFDIPVYISAGAIIDPYILQQECARYPELKVYVHPNAALIDQRDVQTEHDLASIAAVAGTRSGVGAALMDKIARREDAIWKNNWCADMFPPYLQPNPWAGRVFMEISQGFSLGINSQFYPKVTSRECTFMQGMADARFPPNCCTRGYLAFRTFPIRVGNVDGYSSGDWHPDQEEVTWEQVGVKPEITTVTGRERRVATWSWLQFVEAMAANNPTHVFLNFMNYLSVPSRHSFLRAHRAFRTSWENYYGIICGYGATSDRIGELAGDTDSGELSIIQE